MTTSNNTLPILAAVEGGGTSFVLTICTLHSSSPENSTIPHTPFQILHQITIPSSNPAETLSASADFFRKHYPQEQGYTALGIATFGPVGLNPNKPQSYGRILPGSPKREWRNVDVLTPLLRACSSEDGATVPIHRIDTDVNAPAMAEFKYHNTQIIGDDDTKSRSCLSSLAYVTVGTGIGVGLIVNSKPVHGMMHPEGGHVPIIPLPGGSNAGDFGYSWGEKSPFGGKNTVEGTACSVALTERLTAGERGTSAGNDGGVLNDDAGMAAEEREELRDLPDNHFVWDHAANALGNLCTTLTLVLSVEKIVLGGGVMNRAGLLEKIRSCTRELLNGYLNSQQVTTDAGLREFIGPSVWSEASGGVGAGLVGALVFAQTAYEENRNI